MSETINALFIGGSHHGEWRDVRADTLFCSLQKKAPRTKPKRGMGAQSPAYWAETYGRRVVRHGWQPRHTDIVYFAIEGMTETEAKKHWHLLWVEPAERS
jgi:hypothetical protein